MEIMIDIPEEYDATCNGQVELVIKIPRSSYEATCNEHMLPPDVDNVVNAIKDGTPLPEHHGRLIDADALAEKAPEIQEYLDVLAPTIIEGSETNETDNIDM